MSRSFQHLDLEDGIRIYIGHGTDPERSHLEDDDLGRVEYVDGI